MKSYKIFFLVFIGLCTAGVIVRLIIDYEPCPAQFSAGVRNAEGRQKIIIFSTTGGAGSVLVARTLTSMLEKQYDVVTVNYLAEVIQDIDPFYWWYNGKHSAEEIYNGWFAAGNVRFINFVSYIVRPILWLFRGHMTRNTVHMINRYNADLVISVLPFFNGPIARASMIAGKGFLLCPPDFDLSIHASGLEICAGQPAAVLVNPWNLHGERTMRKSGFTPEQIFKIAWPIRSEFYRHYTQQQVRSRWGIPYNKCTVLIIMGGCGSEKIIDYARAIAQVPLPVHQIICVGRNESLISRMKEDSVLADKSITYMGFTDKIAELMACADIIVTKAGPTSIREALQSARPVLIDSIGAHLQWEKWGVSWVTDEGYGDRVTGYQQLQDLIQKYCTDRKFLRTRRLKVKNFKLPRDEQRIKSIVAQLISCQLEGGRV